MEKRYDFSKIEKEMQEFWQRENTYKFDENAGGEIYSIDTPPPTVSGSLHIGHLFSYTQAEIIARFRRMQGENVFYPFGFDDNGLPTERLVEKDRNIKAHTMVRSEFVSLCQDTAQNYENEFMEFWKSLGFSVDWDNSYQTISPGVCKISQSLFLDLVRKNKAYAKNSPVLWCTQCKTSIAQAELEIADIKSSFNYIPFMVDGISLEVATTRPELLFACVCLFVNPNDERYKEYVGKTARVPLYNFDIPILADKKVSIDKGTGVVMCATFGDSTDLEWYNEYNLPYKEVITTNGTIVENTPFIGGMKTEEARKKVINLLDEKGLLLKSESISHSVNTHERCGTAIEIIPSKQWYIDILSEKERFLQAADEINWYPASMKSRYITWVENLKWDWCISRQRYFGIPFPIWYCKSCGEAVFADEEMLPINPTEHEYIGKCSCGSNEFTPETAVLDTWATSSVTPQINERLGLKLTPMSMRTHAHEIIRTWTFYTIVRSLYHTGEIPWKDLMICGFVLAKKGEKISKSKNNNEFEPTNLIKAYSADVLRYWTAGARLGADSFFSEEELNIPKRFITKLYNASKFAISHLSDFDLTEKPEVLPIDKWIIERTNQTIIKAKEMLYKYEIGSAKHEVDELFWKDFCDNYIELIKDRLYKPEIHGTAQRKSAQYGIYYALLNILKLYAIYTPHITEYIYRECFTKYENEISIHKTNWENPNLTDDSILMFGERVKEILFSVRKYKTEKNLSMKNETPKITIELETYGKQFKLSEKDIIACTGAKRIEYM